MLTQVSEKNNHSAYKLVFLDCLREILLKCNLTVVNLIGLVHQTLSDGVDVGKYFLRAKGRCDKL